MGSLKDLIRSVDEWQRHHTSVGVVWAVNKKYSDDQGGYLSALVAYYGFVSIFPLMLAAFSVAAFVLPGHASILQSVYKHLASFPIIGPSIESLEKGQLSGSAVAVVLGLLGLLYGATGLAKTLNYILDETWNVPYHSRPSYIRKFTLSFEWFGVFALGIVLSTALSSLSSVFDWGPVGPVLSALPALLVNIGVYLVSFRLLGPADVTWRQLAPGAAFGGLVWTVLTGAGIGLLTHDVNHAHALYGTFGVTIGFIGFIYLIARLSIYGAELNVVLEHRLWPRAILSPPYTAADRQQQADIAKREERAKDETVRVEF